MNHEKSMEIYHQLLKGDEWADDFDEFNTDQQQGLTRPDVQKPCPADAQTFNLIPPEDFKIGNTPAIDVIRGRLSHRHFKTETLSLEELSFLLWATQGVREVDMIDGITYYRRNVPSGGNRHPFETYLSIHRVGGFDAGLYRYLPIDHKLVLERIDPEIAQQVNEGSLMQNAPHAGEDYYFIAESSVVFIWTATPYRTEWRYGPAGPKLVAIDAGHVCQNLYTACGAIGAGTCAVGAFNRKIMDKVLNIDGEKEFSVYMAPVGKV
ncbi:MAG: SagB/ThcOx family dehydrogenase [Anaerolineales bacterium]|uniref:SagB/ThcOx family dehydrogenase n=1 Tax=Candidatus Desulfolinea nitratireducens TaxID=2841698 RepID=A0A8J6TFC1_9CHLR|nr:SagB/ThcOx family dehydrogenase [Candidatus Desulfolinea nitratireducens]MBL6960118.1 SagB/ThcOx family dehydrogenase [Anaerolineales bacterium]